MCSVVDKLATKCDKIFQLHLNNVATQFLQGKFLSGLSSSRPLISGGQGWGHVFVPVDSTLNDWLFVCWTVLFLQGHFFVRTSNLKANIHIVPFQFVKNSYFKFLQGSVATLFRWSWKILPYFVANLSTTLHISFYQNRSSIVEVMTKNFGVFFMPHSVYVRWKHLYDVKHANFFFLTPSQCDIFAGHFRFVACKITAGFGAEYMTDNAHIPLMPPGMRQGYEQKKSYISSATYFCTKPGRTTS